MPDLHAKKSIDDLWPVRNKKVMMRVDFNVPIKDGIISNDYRIRSTLPSILKILRQGGSVILMSHLGRPKGVSYKDIMDDETLREGYYKTWKEERGSGKTSFFASLSAKDKKQILSWSSKAEEAKDISGESGSGKTYLFSTIPASEKKTLLDKLTQERQET